MWTWKYCDAFSRRTSTSSDALPITFPTARRRVLRSRALNDVLIRSVI